MVNITTGPFTEPTNWTGGMASMVDYANSVTSGLFGGGIMLLFFGIVFMFLQSRGYDLDEAGAVAGFLGLLIGLPAAFLGLIGAYMIWLFVLIAAVCTASLFYRRHV